MYFCDAYEDLGPLKTKKIQKGTEHLLVMGDNHQTRDIFVAMDVTNILN